MHSHLRGPIASASPRRRVGVRLFFAAPRSASAYRVRGSNELFQAGVFPFERPHVPSLTHAEMREALLPDIEGRRAVAQLPTHIGDHCPALRLAQRIRDLFLAELRLFYGPTPSPIGGAGPLTYRRPPYFQPAQVCWGQASEV